FAPSNYVKLPNDITGYLKKNKFLPKLNNELPNKRNAKYKERFTSLQNLVLILCEQDLSIIPKETAWFGFFPDGAFKPVIPYNQTKLYTEDWIGLKTLDDAGRVHFISVPGAHAVLSLEEVKKHVVPYLRD
ncbi:Palm_thioest domain-containing protein, partial [Cephalotus follicularis]